MPDDNDVPLSENDCVVVSRSNGTPESVPVALGVECNRSTEQFCDGNGTCVLCPPGMVHVPTSTLADVYCIDETEVRWADYTAFLLALGGALPPADGTICDGKNPDYYPSVSVPIDQMLSDLPVTYVDWCDARDYCVQSGKRLCGAIGGADLQAQNAYKDAEASEWYRVCSGLGTWAFPYGDSYKSTSCNGLDAGNNGVTDVGAQGNCRGQVDPWNRVYDMSGNVWEWEDACDPVTQRCRLRGGSYNDPGSPQNATNPLACAFDYPDAKLTVQTSTIGFRCCWSPP